ncbi:MAG: polysaccharide pyruvyl transferase family protein [Clostridia bacterium]|nr:polysaccharide pyruvyl transferase family protein [Clostridia bacterium]
MKCLLYGNGEIDNLGCEAISKSATYILKKLNHKTIVDITTQLPDKHSEDIEKFADHAIPLKRGRQGISNIISEILVRFGFGKLSLLIPNYDAIKMSQGYEFSFSVGGDNYCYSFKEKFYRLNNAVRKNNSINAFWGCSIEPDEINSAMVKDLSGFDYIFARESITATALKEKGLNNVHLCSDPAFQLQPSVVEGMDFHNYIGVNLSPLIYSYATDKEMVCKNVVVALTDILNNTSYNLCFIPHVLGTNGDYNIHQKIAEQLPFQERIALVNEGYNCEQTKYIISKLEGLICSRTHASIAGYSSCVPTFVLGYSVKAKGIAKDIYGDYTGHVLPVQDIISKDILREQINNFIGNLESERAYLNSFIPEYKEKALEIEKVFKK